MTALRFVLLFFLISFSASAQKDYKLWLQYNEVNNAVLVSEYRNNLKGITVLGNSETIKIAEKELKAGFQDMLGIAPEIKSDIKEENTLIIGSQSNLNAEIKKELQSDFGKINEEGFIIKSISFKNKKQIIISGKNDVAVLYGVFNFLRILQTNKSVKNLNIADSPKTNIRILNHWDNLDRTVERG